MILHFYIFVVSFLFSKPQQHPPPPTPQKKRKKEKKKEEVPVDENAVLLVMIWSDDIFCE